MTILHVNILLILVYNILFRKIIKNKLGSLIFLFITFVQFVIIGGFKHYSIGIDTIVYYWNFRDITKVANGTNFWNIFQVHRFEPLYTLLTGVVGLLTDNYVIYFVITSIIIYGFVIRFIGKYSNNYFQSIFFFITLRLFDFTLNGLRQSIAMAVGTLAFQYAVEKKPFKFIIWVIMATMIHNSALILLPLYFFVNWQVKKRDLFWIIPLISLFILFRNQIGNIFIGLYYGSNSSYFVDYENTESIGLTGLFILAVIILGFVFYYPFSKETPKIYNSLFNIAVITLLLQIFSTNSYYFKRLNLYYLLYFIIYIPFLLNGRPNFVFKLKKNEQIILQRIIKIAFIILFLIYYISIIDNNYYGILPYNFYDDDFIMQYRRW